MQTTLIDYADLFRLVHFFDVLAAIVFAVSGALVASRKGMDVMGFMWLAVVTGVGGGTMRDLILGVPVFLGSESGPRVRVSHHGRRHVLHRSPAVGSLTPLRSDAVGRASTPVAALPLTVFRETLRRFGSGVQA